MRYFYDSPEAKLRGTVANRGGIIVKIWGDNVKIGVFLQILRKYFDFCYHFSKKSRTFASRKINNNNQIN